MPDPGPLCSNFSLEAKQKENASFWTLGTRKLPSVTLEAAPSRERGLVFTQDFEQLRGPWLACSSSLVPLWRLQAAACPTRARWVFCCGFVSPLTLCDGESAIIPGLRRGP